jgi:hypothetical protein
MAVGVVRAAVLLQQPRDLRVVAPVEHVVVFRRVVRLLQRRVGTREVAAAKEQARGPHGIERVARMTRQQLPVDGERLIVMARALGERGDAFVNGIARAVARMGAQERERVLGAAQPLVGGGHGVHELHVGGCGGRRVDHGGEVRFVVVEHGRHALHGLPCLGIV